MRAGVAVLMACAMLLFPTRGYAQPGSQDLRLPGVRERLESLRPDNPEAYFELGEEIASEFEGSVARRRARELFVLAWALDRASGGDSGGASGGGSGGARLERSVALALASLSDDPYEQRWLLLLGDAHDGREQGGLPDPDALGAAEALGAFRAGDAERLRRLLARSGVSAALGGLAHRVPGLAPLVARMGEVAPCPSCRGRLLVREKPGLNEPLTLCPICGGNPGPALSPEELLVTLRAEDLLLSPPHEGWASQVLLDAGAPVPEGQAMDFARHFRVDPTKVRFVPAADADDPLAGEWTRPPEPGAE